jgi:hypothetical protein
MGRSGPLIATAPTTARKLCSDFVIYVQQRTLAQRFVGEPMECVIGVLEWVLGQEGSRGYDLEVTTRSLYRAFMLGETGTPHLRRDRHERVIKPDGAASIRRVIELKLVETS